VSFFPTLTAESQPALAHIPTFFCMCLSILCVYMFIHVCVHVFIHVCVSICLSMCVCLYVFPCVCPCVCVYMFIHVCVSICLSMCVCLYVYPCVCVYMFIHVCVHVFIHVCVYYGNAIFRYVMRGLQFHFLATFDRLIKYINNQTIANTPPIDGVCFLQISV